MRRLIAQAFIDDFSTVLLFSSPISFLLIGMSQNTYMRFDTPNIESDVEMKNYTDYYANVQELVSTTPHITRIPSNNARAQNITALANTLVRSFNPEAESIPEEYIINAPTKAEKRVNELEENRRTLFAFKDDEERMDYIREVLGLEEDDEDPEEVAGLTEVDLIEAGAELLTDQMSGGKSKKKSKKKSKSKSKRKSEKKSKKNKSKKNKKKNK